MSTHVSTDLPTEVSEQLQAMFAAAQTTLRKREEDAFVATLKAEEVQAKERQAEWAGALMLLHNTLPGWIHQYIQEPTTEYERISEPTYESRFSFVTIEVPGCYPIAAWAESKENRIRLEAMRPELHEDEDGVWTVVSKPSRYRMDRYDIKHGEDDIAVALFQAHEAFLQSLELAATAEERNAALKPAPAPAIPDPIDQARQLVNMLSNNMPVKHIMASDDESDQADSRTLVLSAVGLAIAYHVSRVADVLEFKGI